MTLNDLQQLVFIEYKRRGRSTENIGMLINGLNEEVSEINGSDINMIPSYSRKPGRKDATIKFEIVQALVYLVGVANATNANLEELISKWVSEDA